MASIWSSLSRIAVQALQKWTDDNVDVIADPCDMVLSKALLYATRNAFPGQKNAQYGNELRTMSAVSDQKYVPSAGIVGIYCEIVWKTQPVDGTCHNTRVEMEALREGEYVPKCPTKGTCAARGVHVYQ